MYSRTNRPCASSLPDFRGYQAYKFAELVCPIMSLTACCENSELSADFIPTNFDLYDTARLNSFARFFTEECAGDSTEVIRHLPSQSERYALTWAKNKAEC